MYEYVQTRKRRDSIVLKLIEKSRDNNSMPTFFETTSAYLQKVDNPEGPDASW
jgi:hypothetical protein